MAKSWYIVQTFTGYEQKIERTLRMYLEDGDLDSSIVTNVKVPMEEVVEIRNKKKYVRNNKILPGYIMLEMDLPQLGWKNTCNVIRHVQGVAGFVGTNPNERPRPISNDEAKTLLQQSGEIKGEKPALRIKQTYEIGDHVRITEGSFATFEGVVEEVNLEKNTLRVNVQIFGRSTPVEVDVLHVDKL